MTFLNSGQVSYLCALVEQLYARSSSVANQSTVTGTHFLSLSIDLFAPKLSRVTFKGKLNTDTLPQDFWTTFLDNDLTGKFKKSAVASTITIPLPLCFSCFVPLRRFRENLTKPFYFYFSRTWDSPVGTLLVISLALIKW